MRLAIRNRAVVLLASLVLVWSSACTSPGQPIELATVDSVERPKPVGVVENPTPPSTSAAPTPDCDATASLRPLDPMPAPGDMPAGSTMRKIQDRGNLIVGVDQNTYLFGFRDPISNKLEGFDIDRAREIANAVFGDPNKIRYRVMTSADRIPALVNGDVDVVVRTFTATCARWQKISFSTTYYEAGQRLLVERDSGVDGVDDLGGEKVCAAAGSTSIKRIAAHDAEPVPVQVANWTDCLVMLQQGQVAAVSTDDVILVGMAAQDPTLELVGPKLSAEPYGIGIPKGNEDMVRFVNGVLEQSIASGAWARSYDKWIAPTGQARPAPPTPTYRE